jgi:hypothetical protein
VQLGRSPNESNYLPIDVWRRRQEDLPGRAEAIRRLVEAPLLPNLLHRALAAILNRLNEVSFNAVLLKELRMIALLRQVADPGNSEGAQWAGMRIHRIANEMLTELGASSKLNAEWAGKQHAIFGSASKGEGDQLGHRLGIWLNGCDPTVLGASA